ncbi:MAG TPA: carboxymuconolactone decarboxylase family protein [Parvibaculum sp.]
MTQRLDYAKAAPDGMKALGGVYGYIMKCGLPHSLVDLVYLRVSQINGCAYCIDMHTRDLVKADMPLEKLVLVSVWREGGLLFSEQEQAALAWAETVTLIAQTQVPQDAFDAASAVFDAKALSDLTLAISLMNSYNRMAISFRAVPEAVAKAVA